MKIKVNKYQWAASLIVLILLFIYALRGPIMENKYTKAKMDIMDSILEEDVDGAKEKMKNVLDTLKEDISGPK